MSRSTTWLFAPPLFPGRVLLGACEQQRDRPVLEGCDCPHGDDPGASSLRRPLAFSRGSEGSDEWLMLPSRHVAQVLEARPPLPSAATPAGHVVRLVVGILLASALWALLLLASGST